MSPYYDRIKTDGLAFFSSAGNDAYAISVDAPACLNSVISVGATQGPNAGTIIAPYSNISPDISILAPGTLSTQQIVSKGNFAINQYSSGTSFANPYVAGVWADVKALYPKLSNDQILAAMRATGTLLDDVNVKHIPAINVVALMSFLASGSEIPSLESTFTAQRASFSNATFDLAASNSQLSASNETLLKSNTSLANQLALALSQSSSAKMAADDAQMQISALNTTTADQANKIAKYTSDLLTAQNQIIKLTSDLQAAQKLIDSLPKPLPLIACAKGKEKITIAVAKCPSGWKLVVKK